MPAYFSLAELLVVEDNDDEDVDDEGDDTVLAFFSLVELLVLVHFVDHVLVLVHVVDHVLVHCVDQGNRDELLVATMYVKKYCKPRSSVLTIKKVLES